MVSRTVLRHGERVRVTDPLDPTFEVVGVFAGEVVFCGVLSVLIDTGDGSKRGVNPTWVRFERV